MGFDFPIGIPARYAALVGIEEFKSFLLQLGVGEFSDFFRIYIKSSEISKHRPFYPHKPGGTKHKDLFSALGLTCMDDLRRKCELGHDARRPACPLFWTLGGNQVGRAAIIGWRDVITPALRANRPPMLWPFDGTIDELLEPGNIVIVETYPAECYGWFFNGRPPKGKGKLQESFVRGRQRQRRSQCEADRRLSRDLNLLVPSRRASNESCTRAHHSTNGCSLASTSNASNQRTPGRSSTGSGSCPLALSFFRAAQHTGVNRIRMLPHGNASERQV